MELIVVLSSKRVLAVALSLLLLLTIGSLMFGSAPASGVGDPVIAAAGDIACPLSQGPASSCSAMDTSNLLIDINPAAVLALGDNQYKDGSLTDFMQIYDPTWGRLKSITYPAVGNHEYLMAGASGYFSYFGSAAGDPRKGYYSFDFGAWHLIALNSICSEIGGCSTGSPQISWLQTDLAAHQNQCILAYMHLPYFSSGKFGFESQYATVWQTLYNGHADILLSGHDHDYERFALQDASGTADPGGIRQFVVGTGGSNHTSMSTRAKNSQVYNDTTFGVLKLALHVGSYDWQFLPVPGSSFTDSGTQACHNLASVPTPPAATATPRTSGGSINAFLPLIQR